MLIFLVMGVLMAAGVFIILQGKGSKKVKQAKQMKQYKKMYRFFANFFITQTHLAQIYSKLANLSIYRKDELQVMAVKNLMMSWGMGIGLAVVSFFMFGDFLTILICVMFAILLTNITVDKQLDTLYLKVLKALANLLSNVRQEYMRTNNVVESLSDVEVPDLLKKPMEEIANILVASNGELKLEEFCESTPYRTIQTFAAICYNINNQGDEVDSHGQSNFTQALTLMLSDVNSEIQKTLYRKKRFGMIEYLPFMPIVGIGLIETYFQSIMPGTALIYQGPLGYLCRTLTVLISVFSYTIVSRINCTTPVKDDDRGSFVLNMLEKPRIKKFIMNITPKNKARNKVEFLLKKSISRMTVEQLYFKKVMSATIGVFLAILCAVSTITLGKDFIQNSTQQLSLVATEEMNAFKESQIRELDRTYLANPTMYAGDVQLSGLVSQYMSGLSDLQIQDQMKRLRDKERSLKNAYFKWWYIWICFGVGVGGWFAPNIMLKVRKTLIQTEEEDDFLQLQTLATILMNTNMDTMDMLYQFSQHSRVHKDMFSYAFQGYASNPELELTRLQSKTSIMEFKRFIGKLKLTINDLSIREAYSDLLIEREHILRIRDMTITQSIDKKRGICGPLSMAPLAALIIGEFLIPIGVLGYNEFMNALSSI